PRIENIPELRPLIFRIPLTQRVAKRVNSFLRARFLFVPARSPKRSVEASFCKGVQKRFCFEQPAALLGSERKRISAGVQGGLILVNDEFRANLTRVRVTKLDHFGKFVTGVDMQQWESNLPWEKRLLPQ